VASPTTPPTTPPAIGPTLDLLGLGVSLVVVLEEVLVEVEVDEDDVLDEPPAGDSGELILAFASSGEISWVSCFAFTREDHYATLYRADHDVEIGPMREFRGIGDIAPILAYKHVCTVHSPSRSSHESRRLTKTTCRNQGIVNSVALAIIGGLESGSGVVVPRTQDGYTVRIATSDAWISNQTRHQTWALG